MTQGGRLAQVLHGGSSPSSDCASCDTSVYHLKHPRRGRRGRLFPLLRVEVSRVLPSRQLLTREVAVICVMESFERRSTTRLTTCLTDHIKGWPTSHVDDRANPERLYAASCLGTRRHRGARCPPAAGVPANRERRRPDT